MRLVGTVGRIGSGKDTVIKYLHKRCGLPMYSIGDMVRDAAREEKREISRETLQDLARRRIESHGEDFFVRRLIDRLEEDAPVAAGVTGIRKPIDAETFRERYAGDFLLVHVRIKDPEIRFSRLRERDDPRDPEEFEDFLVHDQREEAMFQIGETLRMADEVLSNDGSLEDLHRQIEEKIIDPYLKNFCA